MQESVPQPDVDYRNGNSSLAYPFGLRERPSRSCPGLQYFVPAPAEVESEESAYVPGSIPIPHDQCRATLADQSGRS